MMHPMRVPSLTGRAVIVRTDDRLPLVGFKLVIIICLSSFTVLSGLESFTIHDKFLPIPSQVKFTIDHKGADCDFGPTSISIEIASAKLHYVSLLTSYNSFLNCSTYGKKENTSIKKVDSHDNSKYGNQEQIEVI